MVTWGLAVVWTCLEFWTKVEQVWNDLFGAEKNSDTWVVMKWWLKSDLVMWRETRRWCRQASLHTSQILMRLRFNINMLSPDKKGCSRYEGRNFQLLFCIWFMHPWTSKANFQPTFIIVGWTNLYSNVNLGGRDKRMLYLINIPLHFSSLYNVW